MLRKYLYRLLWEGPYNMSVKTSTERVRPARGAQRGMTLIEITIALVVLAVAVLMMMSLMLSSNRLQQAGREKTLAYNAARRLIEEFRSYPLAEVYPRYNGLKADDLSGANPGNTFSVQGLAPAAGYSSHGEIVFPADSSGLREFLSDKSLSTQLGLPKDLNRNGNATETGLAPTAINILPVLVRVRWTSQGGRPELLEMATLITDRAN